MRKLSLQDVKRLSHNHPAEEGQHWDSSPVLPDSKAYTSSLHHPQLLFSEPQVSSSTKSRNWVSQSLMPLVALTVWPSWLGGESGIGKGSRALGKTSFSPRRESTGNVCPACTAMTPWPEKGGCWYWQRHQRRWSSDTHHFKKKQAS